MVWQARRQGRDLYGQELRRVMLALGGVSDGYISGRLTLAGHPLSPSYVNYLKKGRRIPAPEVVEMIANVLGCTPDQRTAMHRAAALDYGYEIGEFNVRHTNLATGEIAERQTGVAG